ncbi:hypothetical protein TY523_07730 [Enterobacter hormaechei subsp. xiangfangensis]|uniref:hypothetical protein n=1 Tax=Enterobacter TaxID=547 RepID=UPI000F8345C2|nr:MULTISPECIES: hypothetical protein [Enterobacter]MBF1961034.1 hypothetical protein [Enterobacter hormaechei]MBF1979049.1 hypothetical protein [Enterobacter hormaechei]MBY0606021.1 hypothetical protein [Enterobacter sp. TF2-1-2]MBY0622032.1 hypothetical protein [Enterobacter sp. TF5]MCM8111671.1 hypothetical protein [Enterobacter hormaechei]
MNLYILAEGKQTERRLYPAWMNVLSPSLKKVDYLSAIDSNNYYFISGEGYPRMIDVTLVNALRDLSENPKITDFWVVLDSEGEDVESRKQLVMSKILSSGVDISHCEVNVIVQNPCIETWGLGNRVIISPNKLSEPFLEYYNHYDVQQNDPEEMATPPSYEGSIAKYHESYLKSMLSLRNATYTKKNPASLMEPSYLQQLISRAYADDGHIPSFRLFHSLATQLENKANSLNSNVA